MEKVYKRMGAAIGFLILILVIQSVVSEKAAQGFAAVALLSACILNASTVTNKLNTFFQKGE